MSTFDWCVSMEMSVFSVSDCTVIYPEKPYLSQALIFRVCSCLINGLNIIVAIVLHILFTTPV